VSRWDKWLNVWRLCWKVMCTKSSYMSLIHGVCVRTKSTYSGASYPFPVTSSFVAISIKWMQIGVKCLRWKGKYMAIPSVCCMSRNIVTELGSSCEMKYVWVGKWAVILKRGPQSMCVCIIYECTQHTDIEQKKEHGGNVFLFCIVIANKVSGFGCCF
jgi:hypothetical protein